MGLVAACLLAALGTEDQETDAETVRAFTGALWLAETLRDAQQDLRRLRTIVEKALTKSK